MINIIKVLQSIKNAQMAQLPLGDTVFKLSEDYPTYLKIERMMLLMPWIGQATKPSSIVAMLPNAFVIAVIISMSKFLLLKLVI